VPVQRHIALHSNKDGLVLIAVQLALFAVAALGVASLVFLGPHNPVVEAIKPSVGTCHRVGLLPAQGGPPLEVNISITSSLRKSRKHSFFMLTLSCSLHAFAALMLRLQVYSGNHDFLIKYRTLKKKL